jgi:uncharacterized surface protein with fasciclin (FAS1) repeats
MRLLRSFALVGLTFGACAYTRQIVLDDVVAHPYDTIKNFAMNAVGASPSPGKVITQSKTIFQTLRDSSEFKRLHRAIDFGGDDIAELLDDPEVSLTFFAVPDWVIERHEHHHHHHDFASKKPSFADVPTDFQNKDLYDFTDLTQVIVSVENLERAEDSDDKEERKKFLRRLVRAILLYHVLPDELDSYELRKNITFATQLALPDGSLDGKPMRIRTSHGFHDLNVNFFSKVISEDHKTSNGIIHTIDHPLLPPPTIFQELFITPHFFSYLSTALQRTGLTNDLDLHGENGRILGATTATLFAPTNSAFERLPFKLRLFLFSPFGENVLRKLLEYHVVPNIVLHSDYKHREYNDAAISYEGEIDLPGNKKWIKEIMRSGGAERSWKLSPECRRYCHPHEHPHNAAPRKFDDDRCHCPGRDHDHDHDGDHHHHDHPHVHIVFHHNYTVPTLLKEHNIHFHVAQYRITVDLPGHHDPRVYKTRVLVNGAPVTVSDITSRNGAVHVIDHVLNPYHHHDHHDHDHEHDGDHDNNGGGHHPGPHHVWAAKVDQGWENWEEWLIDWANKN